jgi:hypothetical protein
LPAVDACTTDTRVFYLVQDVPEKSATATRNGPRPEAVASREASTWGRPGIRTPVCGNRTGCHRIDAKAEGKVFGRVAREAVREGEIVAGDWIKIEHATARKPEVFRIADELGIHPDQALGVIVRFWCWVDQQMSEKCPKIYGHLSMVDSIVGHVGFGQAIVDAGWLTIDGKCLSIPNYDEHLSESSKKRAEEAKKKRIARRKAIVGPKTEGQMSEENGTESGPEKEKRREELNLNGRTAETENESFAGSDPHLGDIDWIKAEADFLSLWNDSPATSKTTLNGGMTYLQSQAFRAVWINQNWRAAFATGIARLATHPTWHGRRITLEQFLKPEFLQDLLQGAHDKRSEKKKLPSHLTAGGPNAERKPTDRF